MRKAGVGDYRVRECEALDAGQLFQVNQVGADDFFRLEIDVDDRPSGLGLIQLDDPPELLDLDDGPFLGCISFSFSEIGRHLQQAARQEREQGLPPWLSSPAAGRSNITSGTVELSIVGSGKRRTARPTSATRTQDVKITP